MNAPPVAVVATPVPAQPGPFGYQTAGTLETRCSESSVASIGYCFAYIAAVHDTMRAYETWLSQREFCLPATTAQAELRLAFLGYVVTYPESRQGQAASVVAVALKQAYPCNTTVPVAPAAATPANPAIKR